MTKGIFYMTKTKEELEQLKSECETLKNKLRELTEEELNVVTGGEANEFKIKTRGASTGILKDASSTAIYGNKGSNLK